MGFQGPAWTPRPWVGLGGRSAKRRGGQQPRGRKIDDHQLRVIDKLWQTRDRKVRWMTSVWLCDMFSQWGVLVLSLPFLLKVALREGDRGAVGCQAVGPFSEVAEGKRMVIIKIIGLTLAL